MEDMSPDNLESYSIEEIPSDRRTFTRFQPDDQVRQTLIVVKKREIPARIGNLSSNGCEVLVPRNTKIDIGNEITLLSKLGCFVARVMHVDRQHKDLRIGLKFVGEFIPGEKNRVRSLESGFGKTCATDQGNGLPAWRQALLFGMLVGIGVILGNGVLRERFLTNLRAVRELYRDVIPAGKFA